MADTDLLRPRGVPYAAVVDATGTASGGTSSAAQLAAKGIRAICQVDATGLASSDGTSTVAVLASRGLLAFAAVDENGVSTDDAVSTADVIRRRGIRPMVPVNANGIAATGSATMLTLAQRGLDYFCPVDESGAAVDLTPVPPNTIRARAGIFTFTGETMTPIAGYIVTAQRGAFALAGQNATLIPPAAAYTGPGDVAGWGTAYGYWGLRAYNASKIGANCLDVCANIRGAAVNLTTVVIGSDGYVNLSGIGFSPIYVNRIYDQAGSQDLFQNGDRVVVTGTAVGGKPSMVFTGGEYYSSAGAAVAQAQPISVGVVTNPSTNQLLTDGAFNFLPLWTNTATTIAQNFSSTRDYPNAGASIWQTFCSVANGASSSMAVNGAVTNASTNPGSNGIGNTNKITIGATDGGASIFIGYIFEIIIKAGGSPVSPANQGALNTNQHAIGAGWT